MPSASTEECESSRAGQIRGEGKIDSTKPATVDLKTTAIRTAARVMQFPAPQSAWHTRRIWTTRNHSTVNRKEKPEVALASANHQYKSCCMP
jgi:hypothetical protein